jgi:formamidopyrimidine-DNA glycosylase
MPELPEAEVVRRGLDSWVVGRRIDAVQVLDARSLRRHAGGPGDFADTLNGLRISAAVRRGKFLWMPLEGLARPTALMAHLGMSGQLLVEEADAPDEKHLKVRLGLSGVPGKPPELRFVDQRIFGGMFLSRLTPTHDGAAGGTGTAVPLVPEAAAHIARDVLDPAFDDVAFHDRLRARRTSIKRAILDQGLVSGVGNIYADEALWDARLHYARPTESMRRNDTGRLLGALRDVMGRALAAGGTSFDALYVNVNGASGYFDRSLNAYGRAGRPCKRCGTTIVREKFMNRSSHFCPVCQRKR